MVEAVARNPAPVSPFFDPANEPVRSIARVLAGLKTPVLLLHGESDGWVPLMDGEAAAVAAGPRATLKRYPGLGHALSPTATPAIDSFGVIADAPLNELIGWVLSPR